MGRSYKSIESRFWSKVDQCGPVPPGRPDLGPCWLWKGKPGNHGYGRIGRGGSGEALLVHRWAYEHFVAPIPAGYTTDHLCRVRMCANPSHLEPVTRGENVMRGVGFGPVNAAKTECPRGHAYDDANTAWYRGYRYCRQCNRDKARRRSRAARGW